MVICGVTGGGRDYVVSQIVMISMVIIRGRTRVTPWIGGVESEGAREVYSTRVDYCMVANVPVYGSEGKRAPRSTKDTITGTVYWLVQ
jgi:hypothetical protein